MASRSTAKTGDTQSKTSRPAGKNNQAATSRSRAKKAHNKNQTSVLAAIIAGLFLFLTTNYFGRVLLTSMIIALVIIIEALVLAKDTQLFFRVVGVEILVTLAIGWVVYMVKGRQQT